MPTPCGRTRVCGDTCRKQRAADRQNGVTKSFGTVGGEVELKLDAEEVQHEVKKQELAEKFAPRHTRPDVGPLPQAAPRIKLKRIKLPAMGGYAPVGSPEAAAAIERVKASARKEAAGAVDTVGDVAQDGPPD